MATTRSCRTDDRAAAPPAVKPQRPPGTERERDSEGIKRAKLTPPAASRRPRDTHPQ